MDETYLVGIGAGFEPSKDYPIDALKLQQEVDYNTLTGRPVEEKWRADRETAGRMMEQMATMMEMNPSAAGSSSSSKSCVSSRRTSSPPAPSRRSQPHAASRHGRGSSLHSSAQTSIHPAGSDPGLSSLIATCEGQQAPVNISTLERYTDFVDPYECRILFPHCAWLCAHARDGVDEKEGGDEEAEAEAKAEAEAAPAPAAAEAEAEAAPTPLDGGEPEDAEPEDENTPDNTPDDNNNDDDDDDDDIDERQDGTELSLRLSLRERSRWNVSMGTSRNRLFRVAKVRRRSGAK